MWVALATVCASLWAAALRAHRSLAPALASHAHPPRLEAQTLPSPPYLRLYARRLCSAAALCARCKYLRLKEQCPKYRPRHRPVVRTVSVPIPIRNERSRNADRGYISHHTFRVTVWWVSSYILPLPSHWWK